LGFAEHLIEPLFDDRLAGLVALLDQLAQPFDAGLNRLQFPLAHLLLKVELPVDRLQEQLFDLRPLLVVGCRGVPGDQGLLFRLGLLQSEK
jgi:hypothetical protein